MDERVAQASALSHASRVDDQERRAIEELVDRLRAAYPDVPAETVDTAVQAATAELANHPIRDFVPVLVERGARERLRTGKNG